MTQPALQPLISVIVPAYKAEPYITQTLEAIRGQTVASFECIVVDDGSPDDTAAKIEAFIQNDTRFRLVRKPNGGVAEARNTAIAMIHPNARYVIFQDADDVYLPDAFERLVEALEKEPSASASHGLGEWIDGEGKKINPEGFPAFGRDRISLVNRRITRVDIESATRFDALALQSRLFPPGLVMLRRSIVDKVGRFDKRFNPAEDWHYFLRTCSLGPIAFVNRVVLQYRRHAENMSANIKKCERILNPVRRDLYSNYALAPEQKACLWHAAYFQQLVKVQLYQRVTRDQMRAGRWRGAAKALAHLLVNYARWQRDKWFHPFKLPSPKGHV